MSSFNENKSRVIIVQNLNYSITEDDLHYFFDEFGKITNIRFMYSKFDTPKGVAHIAFENHEMAVAALSKDEKRFLNRYVYVDLNNSPNIEEEMTKTDEPLKFEPMLGKPFSENPLLIDAIEDYRRRKNKIKKLQEQKEEKREEVKKTEEEKEVEEEEKSDPPKKSKKDSDIKKYRKSHHKSRSHRHHHHKHHFEFDPDEDIYYNDIPEMW